MFPIHERRLKDIYPKENTSKTVNQFRTISLLNVEGKIFFAILAKRLTSFLTGNTFIDTSGRKGGVTAFACCVEHTANHLLQYPFEKATRFSYLSLVYNDGDTFGSFSHQKCCLLKYLGFNYVWHTKGTMSVNKLTYASKRNLLDIYEQYCYNRFLFSYSKNNKLQMYGKFKQTICLENYLFANLDKSTVSKFTKLRISNYRLEVVVGRYSCTPNQLRLCKTYDLNAVEDEFHFICVCTRGYQKVRALIP